MEALHTFCLNSFAQCVHVGYFGVDVTVIIIIVVVWFCDPAKLNYCHSNRLGMGYKFIYIQFVNCPIEKCIRINWMRFILQRVPAHANSTHCAVWCQYKKVSGVYGVDMCIRFVSVCALCDHLAWNVNGKSFVHSFFHTQSTCCDKICIECVHLRTHSCRCVTISILRLKSNI